MESENTFYLNKSWIMPMFALDIIGFVCFTGIGILTYLQNGHRLNPVDVGVTVFFALLGLELIDERLRSRIEIYPTEIIYHQPRFSLVCRWQDLTGLLVSRSGLALKFSDSDILSGGLILSGLRLIGPWHQSIPLTPYISRENREQLQTIIAPYLTKLNETDRRIFEYVLSKKP